MIISFKRENKTEQKHKIIKTIFRWTHTVRIGKKIAKHLIRCATHKESTHPVSFHPCRPPFILGGPSPSTLPQTGELLMSCTYRSGIRTHAKNTTPWPGGQRLRPLGYLIRPSNGAKHAVFEVRTEFHCHLPAKCGTTSTGTTGLRLQYDCNSLRNGLYVWPGSRRYVQVSYVQANGLRSKNVKYKRQIVVVQCFPRTSDYTDVGTERVKKICGKAN